MILKNRNNISVQCNRTVAAGLVLGDVLIQGRIINSCILKRINVTSMLFTNAGALITTPKVTSIVIDNIAEQKIEPPSLGTSVFLQPTIIYSSEQAFIDRNLHLTFPAGAFFSTSYQIALNTPTIATDVMDLWVNFEFEECEIP